MDHTGRTVLVTGATGGIGTAVCRRLADAGLTLVLAARHETDLQQLCGSLPKNGSAPHTWIAVDMASDASVDAFAEELRRGAVVLDGVVLMPPQPHSTNEALPSNQTWRDIFQTSFVGPLALLKAAISTMRPTLPTVGDARSSLSPACHLSRS